MSNSTKKSESELDQQIEMTVQYYAKLYCVMINEMADWIWQGRPNQHPIGQLEV